MAVYLSVSPWTCRQIVDAGLIPKVELPVGEMRSRRVLVDRADLDELIATWKSRTARGNGLGGWE